MKLPVLIGAALVAASTFVHAQAPQGETPKVRRFDCSQAKDPKACEERRAKAREMHAKAVKACEASKGKEAEHRACMQREFCAQTADSAKCEAQAKARSAQRDKVREACKDKTGEALKACIREQRSKT
jgi:Spy/CpxP family protein refolding chaperone